MAGESRAGCREEVKQGSLGGRGRQKGRGLMTSPLNPTDEYLAGTPVPQGQTFCGTSLSSLLLAGIYPLTHQSQPSVLISL